MVAVSFWLALGPVFFFSSSFFLFPEKTLRHKGSRNAVNTLKSQTVRIYPCSPLRPSAAHKKCRSHIPVSLGSWHSRPEMGAVQQQRLRIMMSQWPSAAFSTHLRACLERRQDNVFTFMFSVSSPGKTSSVPHKKG